MLRLRPFEKKRNCGFCLSLPKMWFGFSMAEIAMMMYAILSLAGRSSYAIEPVKTCSTAEVLSVTVLEDHDWKTHHDFLPTVETIPSKPISNTKNVQEKVLELTAFGPKLSLLDSQEIDTDISCDEKGFTLTLTITHSGEAATKNIPWRPKLVARVAPYQSGVTARIFWRVRLNDGHELDRLPFNPPIKLPIEITKKLP
jgi:hypothetical protein